MEKFFERIWVPVLFGGIVVALAVFTVTFAFFYELGSMNSFESGAGGGGGGGGDDGDGGGWGYPTDPIVIVEPAVPFDWEFIALVSGVWISSLGFGLGAFFNFRREAREKRTHALEIEKLELEILEMKANLT